MTRQIPLSNGAIALVDDEDYDRLVRWKWTYCEGYAVRYEKIPQEDRTEKKRQRRVFMHNEIAPPPVGREIDHINRNPLDNQKHNFRVATHAQNAANQSKRRRSTPPSSKYIGVSFHQRSRRWRAYITISYRRVYLGYYGTECDAALARDEAARIYHGEFAVLNFPDGGAL